MDRDIGVLIIDDSAIVRKAFTEQLGRMPGIKVLGAAPDPYVGRDMIARLKPDVITLDIEMPRMDGLTFLRKLMKFHPIPTVVVSSLTPKGCAAAVACLEAGAIEVLAKPGEAYSVGDLTNELARIIRHAPDIDIEKRARLVAARAEQNGKPLALTAAHETTNKLIAIGASTGGTDALARVLERLPANTPGIVIVQHMPAGFTTSFAQRLNDLSEMEVVEGSDGDAVIPGRAILAPGNRHMQLVRDGARLRVRISDGPRVCRHRPSVEVLFDSVAENAGKNAMGAILTGMGDDGSAALKRMREAGALTLAQDEATCVVFGMPGVAVRLGAAALVVPIDQIAHKIVDFAAGKLKAKPEATAA